MAPAESPIPAPSIYLTPLVVALAILVTVVLALVALHFLLKKLRYRVHPVIPQTIQARPGVDQKVLDSIPIQAYNKDYKFLRRDHQDECAVCLSGLEEGEMVRVLPSCRHVFHVICIDAWFASHSSCPFCRSEITEAECGLGSVIVGEGFDGDWNQFSVPRRSNSLLCRLDSDLVSLREKLRLKRFPSLDSCNV